MVDKVQKIGKGYCSKILYVDLSARTISCLKSSIKIRQIMPLNLSRVNYLFVTYR